MTVVCSAHWCSAWLHKKAILCCHGLAVLPADALRFGALVHACSKAHHSPCIARRCNITGAMSPVKTFAVHALRCRFPAGCLGGAASLRLLCQGDDGAERCQSHRAWPRVRRALGSHVPGKCSTLSSCVRPKACCVPPQRCGAAACLRCSRRASAESHWLTSRFQFRGVGGWTVRW